MAWTKATTYYTEGSVRGRCPHEHRTIAGALSCLERDRSGCRSQGGYSDREVKRSDGKTYIRPDDLYGDELPEGTFTG